MHSNKNVAEGRRPHRVSQNNIRIKWKSMFYSTHCFTGVSVSLAGCVIFTTFCISLWNVVNVQNLLNLNLSAEIVMTIPKLQRRVIELQNSIDIVTVLERRTQMLFELEERIMQLQGTLNDSVGTLERGVENNTNRFSKLEGRLNPIQTFPVTSCSNVLQWHSAAPSGYYLISPFNGSVARVYCDFNRTCGCDGPSTWTRLAFLNMSDPNHVCPSNWNTLSSPVRTCGRGLNSSGGCSSVFYSTFGVPYSHVCGRIIAYQHGSTQAFISVSSGIDDAHIDGVSLTHGSVGSRRHIWSFVSAAGESRGFFSYALCECSTNYRWPHSTGFVGNDYFCDTGNENNQPSTTAFYSDDPLWDGQGCSSNSTCCQFNNPPWFCKTLPYRPTTDALEVRICNNHFDGDVPIQLIEIYVQ